MFNQLQQSFNATFIPEEQTPVFVIVVEGPKTAGEIELIRTKPRTLISSIKDLTSCDIDCRISN